MSGATADGPAYGDYAARSRATQLHILDTAVQVLIEHGYSGASTLRIQQRAGVSRGRLLHQYPHRDALLVAAVQHIAEARVSTEMKPEEDWPTDPSSRADAAIEAMWLTYHQGHFWAAAELWLASRHNPKLAEALAPNEHALGAAIRTAIDDMFGPTLSARAGYPGLRDVLNTSMRGVALTYSFDNREPSSEPHLGIWKSLARRVLDLPEHPGIKG